MSLTPDDVRRLARLARIDLEAEESHAVLERLNRVLGLIDENLPNYTTLPAAGVAGGSEGDIEFGTAVLVLVVWAVVFFAAGLLVERRRDVD